MEDSKYLQKQENIYWNSDFLYSRWYRKLYGGKWYLYKFGQDTPYIKLFSTWSKMEKCNWSGYVEILDIEQHNYTGRGTKWGLCKEFTKQTLKRITH